MLKKVVLTIFALLFIGFLFTIRDIKESYKVLPIKVNTNLEVPQFAEWREYEPDTKRFKVMLPDPPQYAKESVEIPKTNKYRRYEMYVSEKLNGNIFMISLITYPEGVDISDKDDLLQQIVEEMMESKKNNKLNKNEKTTFEGHPAVDFNITNEKFNVEGKTILVDRTVYLLTYIAKIPDFILVEYEYFIKSFEIEKNATPRKTEEKK